MGEDCLEAAISAISILQIIGDGAGVGGKIVFKIGN